MIEVLDLFSAAAGGWSLGMHRAGFVTMAACEAVDWRRALYAQNNPGVKVYDDVRTLTAERILGDFGRLPSVVVGSPPCQDISSANTKGKGVEGERSGLFFEAIRIIGEVRPRWFALENSANLRTRGADAVLAALEALGYACWPLVVRAGDIGANHERPRSWLVGCDLEQVTDADQDQVWQSILSGRTEQEAPVIGQPDRTEREVGHPEEVGRGQGFPGRPESATGRAEQSPRGDALDTARIGHEGGRTRRHGSDGDGAASVEPSQAPDASDAIAAGRDALGRRGRGAKGAQGKRAMGSRPPAARNTPDPVGIGSQGLAGQEQPWEGQVAEHASGDLGRADRQGKRQVAIRAADRSAADTAQPLWSLDDLAGRLRLDDGLPVRVAGTRVAVGGPRGTSAASLIVEAYGDAVVPQIPEAIGRAILRTEHALAAIYTRAAA